jgi:hypothetical protein
MFPFFGNMRFLMFGSENHRIHHPIDKPAKKRQM